MKVVVGGQKYTVELIDDGTLDTVVRVTDISGNSREERFSQEYASDYRNAKGVLSKDGLKFLAEEVIEGMGELSALYG